MEQLEKITELIFKHLTQDLSPEEKTELDNWVQLSNENMAYFEEAGDGRKVINALMQRTKFIEGIDIEKAWLKIEALGLPQPTEAKQKIIRIEWKRFVAAASIFLVIATGIYLIVKPVKSPKAVTETPQVKVTDALPKSKLATLTLDNGHTLILDSIQQGVIAMEGNMKVTKQRDGSIAYGSVKPGEPQKLLYNTVNIPKGSDVVYLKLSDGSSVWLNAASSIRYPVGFTGDLREITITGEGYFEVAPAPSSSPSGGGQGKKKPFIVNVGDVKVEVLGTHFNINAYQEEGAVKTTLFEGSVKVTLRQAQGKVIKPGEQAITADNGNIKVSRDIDLEQVMAWKNGMFVFHSTTMQEIMQQIERWYDLETVYKSDEIKQMQFAGEMSRYTNASKVLTFLEEAGTGAFHFKIEGKKVILYQ